MGFRSIPSTRSGVLSGSPTIDPAPYKASLPAMSSFVVHLRLGAQVGFLGGLVALAACGSTPSAAPTGPAEPGDAMLLRAGSGTFTYRDERGNSSRPIRVRYWMPPDYGAETAVWIVMHGASRAGQRYFDDWQPQAFIRGALLLVPEFGDIEYPGSVWYNLGHVFDSEAPGTPNPSNQWTFTAIEHLFEDVRAATGSSQAGFRIYGHSAGSQFVHRFLWMRPDAPVERAVAANAGWYTFPSEQTTWPYGLAGSPATEAGVSARLGMDLTVLLGDQDTDTESSSLRKTPEAQAQGPHRFARGQAFFRAAQLEADLRGVPFGWVLDTVRGATHSNALMAPAAAEILAR